MRLTSIWLPLAAALCVVTAVQAAEPVKIGFSIAQTGPLAASSGSQSQAYELWREQVNAKGGLAIAGEAKRPVEFVVYDDQSQGAKAAQVYERLITTDKVDLLLAPYATGIHLGIVPVIERLKRPVVADTVGTTAIRDAKSKYMFLTQPLPDAWGVAVVDLIKSLGVKRVAIATVQLPFAIEVKKAAVPALEKAGIPIVFNQDYASDTKDMTTLITGMKNENPDFILGLSYLNDSATLLNYARELGLQADYSFAMLGPAQASFVDKLGKNADGTISIGFWSRNSKFPGSKEFFDAYKAKWNMVPDDKDTTIAYVACQVLEQAVAKAGLDPEKVRAALSSETFETIIGPVKYNAQNINDGLPAGFTQIQNGVNQVVWPAAAANAKIEKKGSWN